MGIYEFLLPITGTDRGPKQRGSLSEDPFVGSLYSNACLITRGLFAPVLEPAHLVKRLFFLISVSRFSSQRVTPISDHGSESHGSSIPQTCQQDGRFPYRPSLHTNRLLPYQTTSHTSLRASAHGTRARSLISDKSEARSHYNGW